MQNNFAEPRVLKVRSAASVSASSLVVGCGNMDTILQFYRLQSTFRVQHQPADLPLIISRAFHDPPMIHPSAGYDLTWEAWPDSCLAYLPTKSSSSESEEEEKKNSSVFLSPVWSSEGIFRETNRELMENNRVVNKAEWGGNWFDFSLMSFCSFDVLLKETADPSACRGTIELFNVTTCTTKWHFHA